MAPALVWTWGMDRPEQGAWGRVWVRAGLQPLQGRWLGSDDALSLPSWTEPLCGQLWPRDLGQHQGQREAHWEGPACANTPVFSPSWLLHNTVVLLAIVKRITPPAHTRCYVIFVGSHHRVELLYFIYFYLERDTRILLVWE